MNDKKSLRKMLIKRRKEMAQEQVKLASRTIFFNVKKQLSAYDFTSVFCYEAYNGEVQTAEIMMWLYEQGKDVCIPVVDGPFMHTAIWTPETTYIQNRYGINEPQKPVFYDKKIDIALIPGLAFTKAGARLGFGSGYYDKWLTENPAVYKIGLCYAWQVFQALPEEQHDVRMDLVVSENMKDS